jgi:hypothetical protein
MTNQAARLSGVPPMPEVTAGLVVVTLCVVFGVAGLMIWMFSE